MKTIEMDMDTYLGLLEERRAEVEPRGWTIPDAVWDYAMRTIEECGVDPEHSAPSYVVDNLAINGDYGECSNYGGVLDCIAKERAGECLFLYETREGGGILTADEAEERYNEAKTAWMEHYRISAEKATDARFMNSEEYEELAAEIGICFSL